MSTNINVSVQTNGAVTVSETRTSSTSDAIKAEARRRLEKEDAQRRKDEEEIRVKSEIDRMKLEDRIREERVRLLAEEHKVRLMAERAVIEAEAKRLADEREVAIDAEIVRLKNRTPLEIALDEIAELKAIVKYSKNY